MNNTTISIQGTPRNQQIDIKAMQMKLDAIGIDYMQQHGDVYDVDAFIRCWRDTRLPEFEALKELPPGVIRRRLTKDEQDAFGLPGNTIYVATIGSNGDFNSWHQIDAEEPKK